MPTFTLAASLDERVQHRLTGRTPRELAQRARVPAGTSSSRRVSASEIPAAIDSGSCGIDADAADPHASSSDGWFETTTGVPHAIASTTGIPNPSNNDG